MIQEYPSFPGTTPWAAPPFPNILRRSCASSFGFSNAGKCPPLSCSNSTVIRCSRRIQLQEKGKTHKQLIGSKKTSKNSRLWQNHEFFGKERNTQWNFPTWGQCRQGRLSPEGLKVNPQGGSWASTREPIDRYPGQNCHGSVRPSMSCTTLLTFIVFPRIIVRPVMEFFVDPSQ